MLLIFLTVGAILRNKEVRLGSMLTFLKHYLDAEDGQGLVEYGLIIALVALVVVGALTLLGGNLLARFNDIAGNL